MARLCETFIEPPSPKLGEGCAGLATEVSLAGAGLGVVLCSEERVERNRLAPTLILPRLGGGKSCMW